MKKFTKLIAASMAAVCMMAVPVCAATPTPQQLQALGIQHQAVVNAQVQDLIVKAWGNPDGPQWSNHQKVVAEQIAKLNLAAAQNYITYLKGVVNNCKETERVKLEVVTNFTSLSQVNPSYAAMIPQAQAEYQAAVAATAAAQLDLIQAQAAFGIQ